MNNSAADIFYENYRNLPEPLRKKLSFSDMHDIFAVMVEPCLTDLQDELSQYQTALLQLVQPPISCNKIPKIGV